MSYYEAADLLTYRCYRFNRAVSPSVEPERWGSIFSNWQALEARYQDEERESLERAARRWAQECDTVFAG